MVASEMRIAILASTNGGVLAKLLEVDVFAKQVACVISDRPCGAIEVASRHAIDALIFESKSGLEFSQQLVERLDLSEFDLFVSFYTRLFDKSFVSHTQGRLINLHPSILPANPGMDGFGDTLKSGSQFFGATIHFVDEGVDTGAPILQSAHPVNPSVTTAELRHQIFVDQCRMLLQVIEWFDQRRLKYCDDRVIIDNARYFDGPYAPNLDSEVATNFNVPFTLA